MNLNKSQTRAIETFNNKGNLVIESARRTGKTLVLKAIIERNKDKKIGIITYNHMFEQEYKDLNVIKIKNIQEGLDLELDIILGDEVFVYSNKVKTACASTPPYIVSLLDTNLELAKKQKETLNTEDFEKEYGRYTL